MSQTARKLRQQTSPFTIVLALLLAGTFIFFFFGSSTETVKTQFQDVKRQAANALSPPSMPFIKPKGNEKAGPNPIVHYYMSNLTNSANAEERREKVLILTPLARFYQGYWDNLLKLSYPHELISLGFILPKGKEGDLATKKLQEQVAKTQRSSKRFAAVTILRQDTESPLQTQTEAERHKLENQKARRAAMSKARNSLLFTTLGPSTSWVLWLDSDIVETPATLIQDLAAHDKPIITPNCYQRYYNTKKGQMDVRPYDLNSWVDSSTAQVLIEKMGKDDILLEGYPDIATYRTLMVYMAQPDGDQALEVQLDGVGGTALLVKADVHRDGAMFPAFAFYHLIETEGFAKMASRLGWKSWGLPNYLIYHYNE